MFGSLEHSTSLTEMCKYLLMLIASLYTAEPVNPSNHQAAPSERLLVKCLNREDAVITMALHVCEAISVTASH